MVETVAELCYGNRFYQCFTSTVGQRWKPNLKAKTFLEKKIVCFLQNSKIHELSNFLWFEQFTL